MNEITVRLRRRRYFLLRVADEPVLDIGRFLRGHVELPNAPECALLCPVRGESLPLSRAELALVMTVPADRWLTAEDLQAINAKAHSRLLDLAQRGVLLSDPAPDGWDDLVPGERLLEQTQWYDLAVLYQAHSRWQGVERRDILQNLGEDAQRARFEELRQNHGGAPPHFVRRDDALQRMPLQVPVLEGPFFAGLLARRTTRAYLCRRPLPIKVGGSALASAGVMSHNRQAFRCRTAT